MEIANLCPKKMMNNNIDSFIDKKYDKLLEKKEEFRKIFEKNNIKDRKNINKNKNNKLENRLHKSIKNVKSDNKVKKKDISRVDNKSEDIKDKYIRKKYTKEENDKIKKQDLANELEVSVENLEEILNVLGFEMKDLENDDKLKTVVKKALEIESDEELLKKSEITNLFKNIKEILNKEDNKEVAEIEVELKDKNIDNKFGIEIDKFEKEDLSNEKVDMKEIINIEDSKNKDNENYESERNNEEDNNENEFKIQEDSVEIKNDTEKYVFNHNNINQIDKKADINTVEIKENARVASKIIDQVVEHVKLNVSDDKSEMVIKLKPDHLGKLSIKMIEENGEITAKIAVENTKVKQLLESTLDDFKDHLRQQGMNINQLEVSVSKDNDQEHRKVYEYEKKKSKVVNKKIIDDLMSIDSKDIKHENIMTDTRINYIA